MGLLQKNVCPHCGAEYSALKGSCPKCGARKQSGSERAASSTDSMSSGTAASRQEAANGRWQMIFGLCIIAAVIAAVIILITTTLGGSYDFSGATASDNIETTETPEPTPTPTPTPTIDSLQVTFLGQPYGENAGFTMYAGNTVQLGTTHLPLDVEGAVIWTSSDQNVITVDSSGLVTGIAPGSATVTAQLYNLSVVLSVIVR